MIDGGHPLVNASQGERRWCGVGPANAMDSVDIGFPSEALPDMLPPRQIAGCSNPWTAFWIRASINIRIINPGDEASDACSWLRRRRWSAGSSDASDRDRRCLWPPCRRSVWQFTQAVFSKIFCPSETLLDVARVGFAVESSGRNPLASRHIRAKASGHAAFRNIVRTAPGTARSHAGPPTCCWDGWVSSPSCRPGGAPRSCDRYPRIAA